MSTEVTSASAPMILLRVSKHWKRIAFRCALAFRTGGTCASVNWRAAQEF
jgi:hypothetical protein